ncbi:MAG: prephenate dehydrogenase/arogenate dehydrogenase family protein [Thermoanaerobaculia bacterium]
MTTVKRVKDVKRAKRMVIVGGAGRMGRRLAAFFRGRGFHVSISDPAPAPRGFRAALAGETAAADIVIVSASLHLSAVALRAVIAQQPRGLVFDIASVKAPLAPALVEALAAGVRVTSVHPMFGPEVRSFRGRDLIVCDVGDAAAARSARRLFSGCGLRMQTLTLREHDAWVARSMGLAHLIALAAASTLAAEGITLKRAKLPGLSSTSFQRLVAFLEPVLGQEAALTRGIQVENPAAAKVAAEFAEELRAWGELLRPENAGAFAKKLLATRRLLEAGSR